MDRWLASSDNDCVLSCWVNSTHADDGETACSDGAQFTEDTDDPIAQMLKARERALLAALR